MKGLCRIYEILDFMDVAYRRWDLTQMSFNTDIA